ncbi:SMI1/KNR4 family protein [Streptomyces phaeochromogenes]|uniref:SMI1/KNR4 family protein n=1 Tax=Streptomyces phaeochromogenes TaxID=1923 RepID=UPI00386E048E|nr:SMI1/KNR4 family protein [Streptomyces phaeochromogenes]
MSGVSLSSAWLTAWISRVSDSLQTMTAEFERRYGFPPGTNQVRSANPDDQAAARALAERDLASADLVTLYDSIGDIAWADVGNGYFVVPVSDVLLRLKEYGAVRDGTGDEARGLVIGSNGGGLCYVTGPSGVVYRTRTASLDEPELDRIAEDLRHFLELLEQSLTRFVANGEPGYP